MRICSWRDGRLENESNQTVTLGLRNHWIRVAGKRLSFSLRSYLTVGDQSRSGSGGVREQCVNRKTLQPILLIQPWGRHELVDSDSAKKADFHVALVRP
jgi:hypothetical protein